MALKVEELARDGKLDDAELFIFTDNSARALSSGDIQGPRSQCHHLQAAHVGE